MVRCDGARVRCFTRNGHDWADRFPAIVEAALRIKAASFLIDGEAVIARDDGTPDFHALREPTPGPRCGAVRLQAPAGGHRVKAAQRRRKTRQQHEIAHRVFTAAQNCSVTAVVSSVTFQPFTSAFSLANLCSISSIFLVSAYGFQSALDSLAEVFAPQTL